MDPILNFLSSNPIILYTLLFVLVVLATVLTIILVDAYRKGYPLSLWVFQIGERTGNQSAKWKEHLAIDGDAFFEKLVFSNRSGFKMTFVQRIKKVTSVSMLGINLDSVISPNSHIIEEKTRNNCRFRLLMVDHRFFDVLGGMAYATWPGGTRSQRDLGHSVNIFENLISSGSDHNIQLRFISVPPPYTMLLIDPETPHGEIQVELYTYERNTHERPHFILTRKDNPHWYDFFLNEFNKAWDQGRQYKPIPGPKPIKAKAGIVLYRYMNHEYEVLIVTARLSPNAWIFPVGELETDETFQKTALREGCEEGGYAGDEKTFELLGSIHVDRGEVMDEIKFFLYEMVEDLHTYERDRHRKWVRLEEADKIILDDFRPIVQSAKTVLEKK